MYVGAFLIALGGMVLGASAECNLWRCDGQGQRPFSRLSSLLPHRRNLVDLCPAALWYIDCVKKSLANCYNNWEEVDLPLTGHVTSDRVHQVIDIINNIRSLVVEVCDPKTELHEAYIKHGECVLKELFSNDYSCTRTGQESFLKFNAQRRLPWPTIQHQIERKCLIKRYLMACFSLKLGQSCGDYPRQIFSSIIRKVDFLIYGSCDPRLVYGITDLKWKFLDSLDLDITNKTHYMNFFD